jgi:hypothetical protein
LRGIDVINYENEAELTDAHQWQVEQLILFSGDSEDVVVSMWNLNLVEFGLVNHSDREVGQVIVEAKGVVN